MLYYAPLHYVVLFDVTLHFVMSCDVTVYYDIFLVLKIVANSPVSTLKIE